MCEEFGEKPFSHRFRLKKEKCGDMMKNIQGKIVK
jgi:hypothetical protein